MGITTDDIQRWIDDAIEEGATHLMIVCDTFDYDDYPVKIMPGESAPHKYVEYNTKEMQKVMEVYDLSLDINEQLNEHRAVHL